MSISLSDYETGAKYDGAYADDLAALEDRLERLQAAHHGVIGRHDLGAELAGAVRRELAADQRDVSR